MADADTPELVEEEPADDLEQMMALSLAMGGEDDYGDDPGPEGGGVGASSEGVSEAQRDDDLDRIRVAADIPRCIFAEIGKLNFPENSESFSKCSILKISGNISKRIQKRFEFFRFQKIQNFAKLRFYTQLEIVRISRFSENRIRIMILT